MMMRSHGLALVLLLLLASTPSVAQYNEGDFMISLGGSWKSEEYRVKETIDSELDLMIGYYPIKRMGVGLIGNWGLTEFSYAENEDYNFKEGHWFGIGPYIRGHLGPPEFSVFGQLSAVFGSLEQDSENNLAGTPVLYRQEGSFQQYSFGAGVWWYFTHRIGVEALGTADWTNANVRSGNVGSNGQVDTFNSENYYATGGGWSLKVLYWFRLDKGARKPADPGS